MGGAVAPVPDPVARVADVMSTFSGWWALCGGWAVDERLGRVSREHHDVDIVVLHDDQRAIFEHLAGWRRIAHDDSVPDATQEPWDGRQVDMPAHLHIHAQDGFEFEVNFVERSGGDWVFSHEPRVVRPLDDCVHQSAWGLPAVAPGAVLFYKAQMPQWRAGPRFEARPHDLADFQALLPTLTGEQREWLRDALALVEPGHPWLTELRP